MIIFLIFVLLLRFTPMLEYVGLWLLYVSATVRGCESQYSRVNTIYSKWMARGYGMDFMGVYGIVDGQVFCNTADSGELIDNLNNVKKAVSANIKYLLTRSTHE